jgi:hypothetical protein
MPDLNHASDLTIVVQALVPLDAQRPHLKTKLSGNPESLCAHMATIAIGRIEDQLMTRGANLDPQTLPDCP